MLIPSRFQQRHAALLNSSVHHLSMVRPALQRMNFHDSSEWSVAVIYPASRWVFFERPGPDGFRTRAPHHFHGLEKPLVYSGSVRVGPTCSAITSASLRATLRDYCPLGGFSRCSAGPDMAGSLVPAMVNLLGASGARSKGSSLSEEAAKRIDAVPSPAYPASRAFVLMRLSLRARRRNPCHAPAPPMRSVRSCLPAQPLRCSAPAVPPWRAPRGYVDPFAAPRHATPSASRGSVAYEGSGRRVC